MFSRIPLILRNKGSLLHPYFYSSSSSTLIHETYRWIIRALIRPGIVNKTNKIRLMKRGGRVWCRIYHLQKGHKTILLYIHEQNYRTMDHNLPTFVQEYYCPFSFYPSIREKNRVRKKFNKRKEIVIHSRDVKGYVFRIISLCVFHHIVL